MVVKHAKTEKETKIHKTAPVHKKERYFESVGRRKTAIARVRLFSHKPEGAKAGHVSVNGKLFTDYFHLKKEHAIVMSPFEAVTAKEFYVTAKVSGGGLNAQAEAIRLGISRALTAMKPTDRPRLKALGFLKRDPRMVERKKFGSRKARRPQQWRKR